MNEVKQRALIVDNERFNINVLVDQAYRRYVLVAIAPGVTRSIADVHDGVSSLE